MEKMFENRVKEKKSVWERDKEQERTLLINLCELFAMLFHLATCIWLMREYSAIFSEQHDF